MPKERQPSRPSAYYQVGLSEYEFFPDTQKGWFVDTFKNNFCTKVTSEGEQYKQISS